MGRLDVWYYPNNPGGIASVNVTTSRASSNAPLHAAVSEWSGPGQSLDVSGTNQTSTTAGSFTVTSNGVPAGKLGVAVFAVFNTTSTTRTFTQGAGWTPLVNDGTTAAHLLNLVLDYRIGPSSVALSDTETSSTDAQWEGAVLAFK
jgi:hypothetical protein